jgi:IS5 family transposase
MVQPVGSRVEEALDESAALRRFVGVDLRVAPAPDETTICRFRHLLEKHDLGGLIDRRCDHHPRALLYQEQVRRP